MKTTTGIVLTMLALAMAAPSLAQHSHHEPGAAATEPESALAGYEAANAKMHEAMSIEYSGNADVDFARGMIPHHQGAIDMAKVVLKHGKDPEIRKLAEDIVAAQEKEIAWMTQWLEKNGK